MNKKEKLKDIYHTTRMTRRYHAREPLYPNSAVIMWGMQLHKIVYLAVKKGNILVIFTSENIHRELLSLIKPAAYLLNNFC